MLRRENDGVLRKALEFEVDGLIKNGRLKRAWRKQVEEGCMKVGLSREDGFCDQCGVLALV